MIFFFPISVAAIFNDLPKDSNSCVPVAVTRPVSSLSFLQSEEGADFFPKSLDFTIPISSAQTALGLAPSKIHSPADLVSSAVGLIDDTAGSGLPQNGFSYARSLRDWGIISRTFDYGTYLESQELRRRMNTQLSMAFSRGSAADDMALRGAIGIGIPIFDDSDWRRADSNDWEKLDKDWEGVLKTVLGDPPNDISRANLVDGTYIRASTKAASDLLFILRSPYFRELASYRLKDEVEFLLSLAINFSVEHDISDDQVKVRSTHFG